MALEGTVETVAGVVVDEAYPRVEGIVLSTESMTFRVRGYVALGKPAFSDEGFMCAYDVTGTNPFAQAYAHLKTLPAFAAATDA